MDNETTIKMPLPPGTVPNPDLVITQEVPVLKTPFPTVQLPVPVVAALPWHLHVDPIIDMPAPVWDDTPMFDKIYGPPVRRRKPVKKPRYKLQVADYFLIGMGAMVMAGAGVIYGIVNWGWGAGEFPEGHGPQKVFVAPQEPSEEPEPPVTLAEVPRPSLSPAKPPEKTQAAVPVSASTSARPKPSPTRTIIVVPAPKPSATSKSPEPSKSSPRPSPPPSPEPSASTTVITPTPDPGESPDG